MKKQKHQKGLIAIYRQEIMQDMHLFTSQPKAKFYDLLFLHLDTSAMEAASCRTGRKGFCPHAMLRAMVVMKCESFMRLSDLADYLDNNRLIAHYCGFDITKPLPSQWTYGRFLRSLDNQILTKMMQTQVLTLAALGIIDTSFVGLDSTPIKANTKQNNPKSFGKSKFAKSNHPKADKDCFLGVHSASNQHNEKKYEFYWGYKNHVLVDCITGLPICERTTGANASDSSVALDILSQTNSFLSLQECSFLADKGYDVKAVYNAVKNQYNGECFIPLNPRNAKDCKLLGIGHPVCEAGLAMNKDGKTYDSNRVRQKFCCPMKLSKDDAACPCAHPKFFNGKKHRGCVRYITVPDDYRLSIDRDCKSFRKTYALRTECERYNARFKATGQEWLSVRNMNSARNLNTIAHIFTLSVALAAICSNAAVSYRAIKSIRRIA